MAVKEPSPRVQPEDEVCLHIHKRCALPNQVMSSSTLVMGVRILGMPLFHLLQLKMATVWMLTLFTT